MMRIRLGRRSLASLLTTAGLVVAVLPGVAQAAPGAGPPDRSDTSAAQQVPAPPTGSDSFAPTVRSAERHDTSAQLSTIAQRNHTLYQHQLTKDGRAKAEQAQPARLLPKADQARAPKQGGSAAVQDHRAARAASMPDIQANFEGVNNLDSVYPPDTNGDVGGNYYVQWVNLHFQIFDKATGDSLLGPLPGNALWDGFGGDCETHNDGDPIVQYDALADRWMMSQFAIFGNGSHQCIAVSQTGDPTGAWYRYDFLVSNTLLNDYPHFGVWPDAYYMSINEFDLNTFAFEGAGAIAFEREQMLIGAPAQMVYFDVGQVNPIYGGQLPSDLDGAAPPAGAPNIFAEADDDAFGFPTDRINAWEFHVDWANPANSTFGNNGEPSFSLDTAPFDANMCGFSRSCIPQPDTSVGLDAISDRIMYRLQYRNFGDHQSLVLNHTVDTDGNDHAGIRWYELRSTDGGGTWGIHQQGTYAPDAEERWMASAAMDVSGNIAIGYTASSETTYPSIRIAGRLASDPLGELPQAEGEIMAGTGSQTGSASRWGDYSAMQVDSADQCTFYYTSEYLSTTGPVPWQTRIGSFKFPNCSAGPSGTVAGTVTDADTGDPIAGATVTASATSTRTGEDGSYSLTLPVGSYDMTASAFGYDTVTAAGVQVNEDQTTTQDFALTAQPMVTVSGTVTDGSGHGWPLYAKIAVQDTPFQDIWTDPNTGSYSVQLPANATYTFHVAPQYPGYSALSQDVVVASSDLTQDFQVLVDEETCTAPGYEFSAEGIFEQFESGALPAGWQNVDNLGNGQVWEFDNPGGRENLTGGTGEFAIVDSDAYGPGNDQDTSLVSPSADLSGNANPVVSFAEDYNNLGDIADVDVSIDGGTTWTNVLRQTTDQRGPRTVTVPLPMAANQSDVRVRFHYYEASWAWWWMIDDVLLGVKNCVPISGGLVNGFVTDGNTDEPLNGVKVTSDDHPADSATTAATPDDDNLADGYYWLFSSLTGNHPFTASLGKYQPDSADVDVPADSIVQQDFTLGAGHLVVTPEDVTAEVVLGEGAERTFTIENDGTASAHVTLSEQRGAFTILGADGEETESEGMLDEQGAPLHKINGTFLPFRTHKGTSPPAEDEGREFEGEPWEEIADYPVDIMDNAVAFDDGKTYSVGGYDGFANVSDGYVYDPTTLSWSPIAPMPAALEKPTAEFIDGLMYVAGGWGPTGNPSAVTYIYDPASDSWSTANGTMLAPVAAPASTVVDGKMYVFGGCDTGSSCGVTSAEVYDPAADTWTAIADYPEPTSWQSCGALSGTIYCAGGTASSSTSTHTYAYDPGSDSYTQLADLPIDLWASGYTAANDLLLVSGGVTDGFNTITNQGFAYDPSSDTWEAIPNSPQTLYRGGSSCGFYRVGGSVGGFSPDAESTVLPGFDQCGTPTDVTWFSEQPTEFDVAPGASQTVTVTLDSSQVTQPGTYTGGIKVGHDTPYRLDAVDVTMVVDPPRSWGKLLGTVEGTSCDDQVAPLSDATVQINGDGYSQTLATEDDGTYAIWLDSQVGWLREIVAKDGYVPQTRETRVKRGRETVEDFVLRKAGC